MVHFLFFICRFAHLLSSGAEEISIQVDHSAQFLDDVRLDILAHYLEKESAASVKVERNETACSQPPSIHLNSPGPCSGLDDLPPPVIRVQGTSDVHTIGLGHSDEGEIVAVKAFANQRGWGRFVDYPGIRDVSEIVGSDAVLVACQSWKSYVKFRKIFREWIESSNDGTVTWFLREECLRKIAGDMSFIPSVAGAMARVRVFGVKRAFTGNENAMRISRLYQKVNGLEPNEKATINSVYLYEATLALHHLLNAGKAFSIDKELKELNSKGVHLQLDSKGTGRIHASYNIYELGETFTRLVAVYQNKELLEVNSKPPARSRGKRATPIPIPQCPPAARGSDGRRHFRAYAVVEPPMIIHTPREPVSGFMVDVMDYLSQALDFTYNITLLGDGHSGGSGVYGTVTINETTGEVNATGLIGLVYNCKADLAVGSLSISIERQKVIDFSKPWHDFGLLLMAPNPAVIPSSIWSCFSPFSVGAWMLVLTALVLAILSVPIMIALTGRPFYGTISDNLDRPGVSLRQRLYDSLWFLFSTGLGWGPDGANLPVRIILAGFFAFMLVATSTYTANLAAFLTAVQTVTPIASVNKLASQTNIPFGTVRQTAVEQAFLTSTLAAYKDIGNFMQANPEYMVDTVQQGIDLVKGSANGYVFIWDSPTLEYYAEKKPCTAQVVGRTFMEKSYAIGMPKGMPYRADFSGAILKMRAGYSSLGALARAYLTGECTGLGGGGGGGGGGSGASGISVIHIVGSVTFMFLAPLGLSFVIGVAQRVRRDCRKSSDGNEESPTNAPVTVIGMNDVSNRAKAAENESTNE